MTSFNFVSVFLIAACCNVALTAEDVAEVDQGHSNKERAVGRSYSLTTCDYKTQIGYTCLNCNRALHCYAGNVAILVDCYGPFRYCRDGRCSRFQGEKCTDSKATTLQPFNATITDVTGSEATTREVTGVTESAVDATGTVTALGGVTRNDTSTAVTTEKATTKSDVTSSTVIDISSNVV